MPRLVWIVASVTRGESRSCLKSPKSVEPNSQRSIPARLPNASPTMRCVVNRVQSPVPAKKDTRGYSSPSSWIVDAIGSWHRSNRVTSQAFSCMDASRITLRHRSRMNCDSESFIFEQNDEWWHRLPGAPLRNRVKGCGQEGHFDSGRVAGCSPPSCSASLFHGGSTYFSESKPMNRFHRLTLVMGELPSL